MCTSNMEHRLYLRILDFILRVNSQGLTERYLYSQRREFSLTQVT